MINSLFMQLLTGNSRHPAVELDYSGAYAWKYTDVLSDDGVWAVVLIAFRGMPMSPDYLAAQSSGMAKADDHCGYAVSVYYKGSRIAFEFCGTRHEPPNHLHLGSVQITLKGAELEPSNNVVTADHTWTLVAPRCRAHVRVLLTQRGTTVLDQTFEGWAYADRNAGCRAMQEDFRTWCWGRVHTKDRTIVYLATPDATQPFVHCGQTQEGSRSHELHDIINASYLQQRPTLMGLMVPTVVSLVCRVGHATHTITSKRVRVLENSPFYQRYIAEYFQDGVSLGRGIAEYMNVRRLAAPWIRPFLRLPWQPAP